MPLRILGCIVVYCTIDVYCIVLLSVVLYFNAFCSVCCKFCDFWPSGYDSIKSESESDLSVG